MDFAHVLRTLRTFFFEANLPFAVIGGFGLHAYGLSRATYDVDLLTGAEAQVDLMRYLESLGYRTLHRSAGYSNHLHAEVAWGRLDMVYVRGDTRRTIFASCRQMEIAPGLEMPVPRPEHLAALKVHAMHNDPERLHQEMADIRYLLGLPETDRESVEEQFEKRGMSDRYRDLIRSLDDAD